MGKCIVATMAALCVAWSGLASGSELLPRPEKLEPNVRFWMRIYTEVASEGGLIHDSRHLDVVYEEVRFPAGLSHRAREKRTEKVKKRYVSVLRRLAAGKRTGLSTEEARVLSLWPEGTSDETLRRAASRVRFQLGQADRFRAGLARSGYWRDYILTVLEEHDVPRELVALPHVESSYNPRAYSRVGAAGLWQFTRSTGRRYLRVDHVVDERMDPHAATVAAARLLSDNHRRLKEWPLAITAYNHGVSGMARAVRKLGTRDIGTISERYSSRIFGFASRNFYSEFLAASEIDEDPERFFGPIEHRPPVEHAILEMDHYYEVGTLEAALGVPLDVLREHNLALRPAVWNGAKLVPRGYGLRIPREALAKPLEQVLASIPADKRVNRQHRDRFHKVRRGETLSRIASRYRVSERELVSLNNLRNRHTIRVGQVLRLPDDLQAPIVVARQEPPAGGFYRVRRGDNLTIIAARFGVPVERLAAWNSLRDRHHLAVGQKLRVTQPTQPVVVASVLPAVADAAEVEAGAVVLGSAAAPAAEPGAPEPVVLALAPAPEPAPEAPEIAVEPEPEPAPIEELVAADEAEPGALDLAELAETARRIASDLSADPDPDLPVVAVIEPVAISSPDPSNYAVTADQRVTVQAEETLGHYAEWLEVSASRLRQLNRMSFDTPLVIGRQKKLDFSRVTPEVFEMRRLEYHRDIQEEFFAAYVVAGTATHVLRRGESLWYLANDRYEVPIWLLRQYNPDLDFGNLVPGTRMMIPSVEPRPREAASLPPS